MTYTVKVTDEQVDVLRNMLAYTDEQQGVIGAIIKQIPALPDGIYLYIGTSGTVRLYFVCDGRYDSKFPLLDYASKLSRDLNPEQWTRIGDLPSGT